MEFLKALKSGLSLVVQIIDKTNKDNPDLIVSRLGNLILIFP